MRTMLAILTIAAVAAAAALGAAGTAAAQDYDPKIDPADFTTDITNRWLNLPAGKRLVYETETEDGEERIVITVSGATKTVMGVETLVVRDRVFVDGELEEDTRDYLAQDKAGNVWYFGEDVDNYEDGKLANNDGAWLAGVDGAKPGILFPANPQVGQEYRQEFYKGEAEDMARIVALDQTVTSKLGIHEGCVRTLEWTPLEADSEETKFFCPAVGGVALVADRQGKATENLAQLRLGATDDEDDDDEDDDDDDADDDD